MGFERRHWNEAPGREDPAVSLARAYRLELERAREVLRRAEQAAAEDPQARPIRQWFEIFVEEDLRATMIAGRRSELQPPPDERAPRAPGARPAPGRQTLVMREAQADERREPVLESPTRDPARLDIALQWRMSQAFGFDASGVSILRDPGARCTRSPTTARPVRTSRSTSKRRVTFPAASLSTRCFGAWARSP